MKYVKHRKKRVNLEAVAGYQAKENELIEFIHAGEPIEWRFASKAERNTMLETLDDIVEIEEVKVGKGYVSGTVNAAVID